MERLCRRFKGVAVSGICENRKSFLQIVMVVCNKAVTFGVYKDKQTLKAMTTLKELLNSNTNGGNCATIDINSKEEITINFAELSIVYWSNKIGLHGDKKVFNFYYDYEAFKSKLTEFVELINNQ